LARLPGVEDERNVFIREPAGDRRSGFGANAEIENGDREVARIRALQRFPHV
jgi:hypothetical protein